MSPAGMSLLLIFGGAFALLMLAVRAALEAGDQGRPRRQAHLLLAAVPLWVGAWAVVPSLVGPGAQATASVRAAPQAQLAHPDR